MPSAERLKHYALVAVITLVIAAGPLVPWSPDTSAVTVPWPCNERSALAGVKRTSYAENVVALAEPVA